MGRRFEELGDVCDAHELRLELHAGGPVDEARFTVSVWDGADGRQATFAGGSGDLDVAAEIALGRLRRAGVVP